ncbi:MAG: adenosylcobalamin-dependent ribonucleoside-diphosphate reductase, partial [Elusimicrobiota bacterium]
MKVCDYDLAFKKSVEYFKGDKLSAKVFLDKYALRNKEQELLEDTPDKMHRRIAKEFARIEDKKFKKPLTEDEIFDCLDKFKRIVPQGSLLYGVGNRYQYVSVSNCFISEIPMDSYGSILYVDEQLVQISKRRGGVGTDLSELRPAGTTTSNAAKTSTGVISFMERYSNSIREVGQHGRRGALMLSLSIHHPEVLAFAKAKMNLIKITGANLSIRLTDEFMWAVQKNEDYEMRWPVNAKKPKISRTVNARSVWQQIIECAHAVSDPGLLFWDNILKESPADCYEEYKTQCTNPCGEVPLSPLDSCRLLLLNALTYVRNPFQANASFDFDQFYNDAMLAQRLMDDVIDLEIEHVERIISKIEKDPEPNNIKNRELNLWRKVKKVCKRGRRTGTGITALGDTIAACNLKYGSKKAIGLTHKIYKTLKLGCYRSSVNMAKEIGAFPVWDKKLETKNPFLLRIKKEDPQLYDDMQIYGRRNISLLTSSPAGSVSLLTQTTSGIEPLFEMYHVRRKKVNPNDKKARVDFVDANGDSWEEFKVYHPTIKKWMEATGKENFEESPWFKNCANDIHWKKRLKTQKVVTENICHSISSTINLPEDVSVKKVAHIYEEAWKMGLKGITVYRQNSRTGVLVHDNKDKCNNRKLEKISHTDAPKRPKILPCDIHHLIVKGKPHLVLVGLYN